MNRAVFLDRDNTIIHNDGDLGDPDLVRLIQGAAIGIASMRGLGYRIVVVSNQGGVARGRFTEDDVDATNERIAELTAAQANGATIDRFYYCPFHPEGTVSRYKREHPWRKPSPGMLEQAAKDLKLDLGSCWMVGDALRDIEAGQAAGCRTILIADPQNPPTEGDVQPDHVARNLVEAARLIAQARPDPAPSRTAPGEQPKLSLTEPDEREREEAKPTAPSTATGTTYPATQKLETTHRPQAPSRSTQRPFKPWSIQSVEPMPTRAPHEAAPKQPDSTETEAEAQPAEAPAEPPSKPAAREASPPSPPKPTSPARAATLPVPEPEADDVPQPAATSSDNSDVAGTLHQILRLLKQQHALYGDWSASKIVGLAVLQPLAAATAGVAVFQDEPVLTLSWLIGAVFLQLGVITSLFVHQQR